jgi:hypothetical protein
MFPALKNGLSAGSHPGEKRFIAVMEHIITQSNKKKKQQGYFFH